MCCIVLVVCHRCATYIKTMLLYTLRSIRGLELVLRIFSKELPKTAHVSMSTYQWKSGLNCEAVFIL